jgi:D-xylose transport system permease protein
MSSSATTTAMGSPSISSPVSSSAPAIDWRAYRSVIGLGLVMLILAYLTDWDFVSARNLTNLSRQVAINGILAVGMTFVILIGGIDLSVGSVAALSGVVAGLLQVNVGLAQWQGGGEVGGALISMGAAILTGLFCGVFNGFLITRYRIAPFIITLGMMVISRGLALIVSDGAAIAPLGDTFNALGQNYLPIPLTLVLVGLAGLGFASSQVLRKERTGENWMNAGFTLAVTGVALWAFQGYRGLPLPVLIFALLGWVGSLVLQRMRLGRFILAIGGNSEAAWLAGVPIRKITFGIYVTLGALAGLCGAILSARLNGALPTAGDLFELDAIAAVVIGGTSLLGGIGTVRGSILGAFFIGALNNGMSLMGVSEFYQKVIKGLIIILAVWFDTRQSRAPRT